LDRPAFVPENELRGFPLSRELFPGPTIPARGGQSSPQQDSLEVSVSQGDPLQAGTSRVEVLGGHVAHVFPLKREVAVNPVVLNDLTRCWCWGENRQLAC
jgi:hypothetical protein